MFVSASILVEHFSFVRPPQAKNRINLLGSSFDSAQSSSSFREMFD